MVLTIAASVGVVAILTFLILYARKRLFATIIFCLFIIWVGMGITSFGNVNASTLDYYGTIISLEFVFLLIIGTVEALLQYRSRNKGISPVEAKHDEAKK